MANVKISQLPSLTTMTDAAEIPVVAGGVTYQITGANLTNYFTGIYGNANVVANLAALGTNPISTTGNVTGSYILGNGSQLTGLAATYGNANVVANLAALGSNPVSTTGNVTGGNILTGGLISAIGNITAGNLDAVNLVINSISSDDSTFVTIEDGVNVNGTISATGNISGNYFIGNGSLLTGMSNTGNVTFSGEIVIGTGTSNLISGLYLAPSSSSANANMYLRVRGNITDEPTHIHFDTGNNAYYNQFIGDDNKYIQLANTGNIIINSNDGAGNSAQWTFGSNSKITLPNGATIRDTSGDSVAFGQNAGLTSQAQHAVAIGINAGREYQGEDSVAIGYNAGYRDQGRGVAIGWNAGQGGTLFKSVSDAQGGSGPVHNYVSGDGNPTLILDSVVNVNVNDKVFGNNIPAGAFVASINDPAINISAPPTAALTAGDDITFVGLTLGLNNATNVVVGMRATGTDIPANTFVQNTGCSVVEFNQYPTAPLTDGATIVFSVGQGFGATAVGYQSGSTFQGDDAVAVGRQAGYSSQNDNTVAVGGYAGYNVQGANAVAVGYNAGQGTQGINAVAVGYQAGQNTQGPRAVAIGEDAGYNTQGEDAVAVGQKAGFASQGQMAIAIGNTAGYSGQGQQAVAIGYGTGLVSQQLSAVAIGANAASYAQGSSAVAIGELAGNTSQGLSAVAVGYNAGYNTQGGSAVAIGENAGYNTQGNAAVAIGENAGAGGIFSTDYVSGAVSPSTTLVVVDTTNIVPDMIISGTGFTGNQTVVTVTNATTLEISASANDGTPSGLLSFTGSQGILAVAIGNSAGQVQQGNLSVAIGSTAGNSGQGSLSVAIGYQSGAVTQGASAVAVGAAAGAQYQGTYATAIGPSAGFINQGQLAVAIGPLAAANAQGSNTVAIGSQAGAESQGIDAVAIGAYAGNVSQGNAAVAIGRNAGNTSQRSIAVAIGSYAGNTAQGNAAVAVGASAGYGSQGNSAVAVGESAGESVQGNFAVAIGAYAGATSQGNNSIILNATGVALNQTTANTFTVKPVRGDSTANLVGGGFKAVYYNSTTGEFAYSTD